MKKIIIALLVLSVALIGMSFVAASSDVGGVNNHADGGNGIDFHNDVNPFEPHFPSGPTLNPEPNPHDPFHPQPIHQF